MRSKTHVICMISTRDGVLPVLFIAGAEESAPVCEQIALIRHLARQGYSPSQQLKVTESVGRFCDWLLLGEGGSAGKRPAVLPDMLRRFLVARYEGTVCSDGSDVTGLRWLPVKAATVETDRRNLNKLSDFAATELGYFALNDEIRVNNFGPDGLTHRACTAVLGPRRAVGLLAHLAHLRHPRSPRTVGKVATGRRPAWEASDSQCFPLHRLTDLISAEHSVAKRMLWIELAFGGVRLSEALNHFVDDVLPGKFRPMLFPGDVVSELPLVVLADPVSSTFIGSLELSSVEDRRQYLHRRYSLTPRPLRPRRGDPLHVGWKGMAHDDHNLMISQVYWSHRGWAGEYWRLYRKLLEIRSVVPSGVRDSHPYLYIVDQASRSNFGTPLKVHTAEKAFARLCTRIGLRPYRAKASPHGLRHAYRRQLRLLGIAPRHVQRCMHHATPDAQDLYDRASASDINTALTAALSTAGSLNGGQL
jgi:hypothetical protein